METNQLNQQLKKAIKKTIKFFETHRWGQDLNYNSVRDTYCIMGGFREANFGKPYGDSEVLVVEFKGQFKLKFGTIPVAFNDKSHQKKQRVIAKLQKLHDLL